jgi:CRISPR-associated protein Cas1
MADTAVVLLGLRTRIGAAVLHQLADFDVVAMVCDWKGVPAAGLFPWTEHTRVAARQNAQVAMSLPRRKNAWARVVRAKIMGQAANLRHLGHDGWARLENIAKAVRSGDPGNAEAQAARYYWPRLLSGDGFTRNPQAGNGRNGMLDYGYTVLRGHGIRAVLSAGLTGAIGLHHSSRSNAFNLVDDLIEPFRPAIDWVVANMPQETSLDEPPVKHALVAASSQPFGQDGLSVASVLSDLAQQLGRYAENQVARLAVPCWQGPQRIVDEEALL